jgi:hypothetical protein
MSTYTPPPPPPLPGTPIPNYLWQSIVSTICCCPPLGIVAIIFAAQVNSKLAIGDVAGAQEASRKARMFCWLAFGLGLLIDILILLTNGALLYTAIQEGQFNS